MSLAPNSITKVRVYIYIEGQDIDNYDFASIGKMISVNFGFTKERMEPEDIDYEGTYFEKCEGGTAPTEEAACTAANGTWDAEAGKCSGHTKAYCDAIGGAYSTTVALTGICYNESGTNAFASKEACDGVTGEWDGTTCRVTESACKNNAGTNKWSGN